MWLGMGRKGIHAEVLWETTCKMSAFKNEDMEGQH
jgi:hypothetical protein